MSSTINTQSLLLLQRINSKKPSSSYGALLDGYQKTANKQFAMENLNEVLGNWDDGAYFLYALLMPGMLEGSIQYEGPLATKLGIAGQAAGFVQAGLCFAQMLLDKIVKDEARKKSIRRLMLHAEQIQRLQNELDYSYAQKSNEELQAILEKMQKGDLDDEQQHHWQAAIEKKSPVKKSRAEKVLDGIEKGVDLLSKISTGIGYCLYGIYYFGQLATSALLYVVLNVGPVIGFTRWAAVREARRDEEKLASLEDHLAYFRRRHALLKQIRKNQKRRIQYDQPPIHQDDETLAYVNPFYETLKRRLKVSRVLDYITSTQSKLVLGFAMGIFPVSTAFTVGGMITGVALSTSLFAIIAPAVATLFVGLYIYKQVKTIRAMESEYHETLDRIQNFEINRTRRWVHKYGAVPKGIDEHLERDSTAKLVKKLLKRVVELDDDEERFKLLAVINDHTPLQVNRGSDQFYNHLLHYISEGKTPVSQKDIALVQQFKSAFKIEGELVSEKPKVNVSLLKKWIRGIGRVVAVACPIYAAIAVATAFLTGPAGLIALGVIGGVTLISIGIGQAAQIYKEHKLDQLVEREHKLAVVDRLVKVESKSALRKNGVNKLGFSHKFARPKKGVLRAHAVEQRALVTQRNSAMEL